MIVKKFGSIQPFNWLFYYGFASKISSKSMHFHRFHKMSAKWLKASSTVRSVPSTFQQFHSVNTEQYGAYGCLALCAAHSHSVSLIWRRPALKIVVLMLQYQTIDRNIVIGICVSFVWHTPHCKHIPTCSVQSECFFENSSFANVCTTRLNHKT